MAKALNSQYTDVGLIFNFFHSLSKIQLECVHDLSDSHSGAYRSAFSARQLQTMKSVDIGLSQMHCYI